MPCEISLLNKSAGEETFNPLHYQARFGRLKTYLKHLSPSVTGF